MINDKECVFTACHLYFTNINSYKFLLLKVCIQISWISNVSFLCRCSFLFFQFFVWAFRALDKTLPTVRSDQLQTETEKLSSWLLWPVEDIWIPALGSLRSWHLLSSLRATLASHKLRPVTGTEDDHLVKLVIKRDKKPETSVFAGLLVAAGGCWRVFYLFYPGLRSVINCDNVIHWVQASVISSDRL